MKASLQTLCDSFIENRDLVKSVFRMESNYIYPLCANLFCVKGQKADRERLISAREVIRSQTGIFSNFRGHLQSILSSVLAMEDRPEEFMDRCVNNYQLLKQYFWGSDHLALAAFLTAAMDDTADLEEKAARGKSIYRLMKQEHPFLTASEDSVFAVMMAFSPKSDEALIQDMESCYRLLRERFLDSNSVQTVSHVLALAEGEPEEKTRRVLDLYDALLAAGSRYGRNYELAALAALAALPVETDALAGDMMDVEAFLSGQKGYGFFGLGRRIRLMHAAMIVSDEYAPRGEMDTAATAGTLSMIAAQEMAACSIICATSATAATAASSNS